jgi:hypothetical protein
VTAAQAGLWMRNVLARLPVLRVAAAGRLLAARTSRLSLLSYPAAVPAAH